MFVRRNRPHLPVHHHALAQSDRTHRSGRNFRHSGDRKQSAPPLAAHPATGPQPHSVKNLPRQRTHGKTSHTHPRPQHSTALDTHSSDGLHLPLCLFAGGCRLFLLGEHGGEWVVLLPLPGYLAVVFLQRVAAVDLTRGGRQHVVLGVVLADATQLRRILHLRKPPSEEGEGANDGVESGEREGPELGFLAECVEHHVALVPHGERTVRPADGEDGVPLGGVLDTADHEGRQVGFADGVAAGDGAVTEHDEWPALVEGLQLSAEALEESGRSHNGVGDVLGTLQCRLKLQLSKLELQDRFIHTESRQQHEMLGPAPPRSLQQVQCRLIVHRIGVTLDAAPARQTRHNHVIAPISKHSSQTLLVRHLSPLDRGALHQPLVDR
mmetsp:Transcript_31731/g.78648  ORF Transcript_31731/g.78648 Transcript_31731/m.78648 type:complete len:381 (+) Transcript_31731:912-2054(+)